MAGLAHLPLAREEMFRLVAAVAVSDAFARRDMEDVAGGLTILVLM